MKDFIKLLNFELGRFFKIYLALAALTIVLQIAGTVKISKHFLESFEMVIRVEGISIDEFLNQYGAFSLHQVINSGWFNFPIMLAIAALIFYCFLIWYRDWFGKNTFIYRLLMLPTARINIYLSKAISIFLMVLGLVALQIILLQVEGSIVKWLVPANLRIDFTTLELIESTVGQYHLGLIIPLSLIQFLVHYGVGFMLVFVLFTAILFERSYRLKGILYGGVYAVISIGVFFLPAMIGIELYPEEWFFLELFLGIVVTVTSIWLGNYLLNKKVTV